MVKDRWGRPASKMRVCDNEKCRLHNREVVSKTSFIKTEKYDCYPTEVCSLCRKPIRFEDHTQAYIDSLTTAEFNTEFRNKFDQNCV